jgi:hypothetical protein
VSPEPQFNAQQRKAALEVIERLTWGDFEIALICVEMALRRALEATQSEFQSWEHVYGPMYEAGDGWSEYTLPADIIEAMEPEEKLAYVARLLRSLAIMYGVSADIRPKPHVLVGEHDDNSPAALTRGLNDISWLP